MSKFGSLNRFKYNPTNISLSRSVFNKSYSHKTTFNSGYLVPISIQEVLPGDTYVIDIKSVVRMLTPAVPVMDNANIDIYAFYAPNRILCKQPTDWQSIFGENFTTYWAQPTEKTLSNTGNMCQLKDIGFTNDGIQSMSLANYLGLPIVSTGNYEDVDFKISLLPFNMYYQVWNDWFRDENTQAPHLRPTDVGFDLGSLGVGDIVFTPDEVGLLRVNKVHDYFTSALNAPQKGAPITIPLLGNAPVFTGEAHDVSDVPLKNGDPASGVNSVPMIDPSGDTLDFYMSKDGGSLTSTSAKFIPSNLWADLSSATAISTLEIRQAFALQRALEKDARGGTRYIEFLKAHFGVTAPNDVLQRPEYLGGCSIPLTIATVLQNSATVEGVSPLGATGAVSNSSPEMKFTKSFIEHGYIMIVVCVRTEQTYCQGVPRHFTRERRFDWYDPVFANISEQPIYNYELYIDDSAKAKDAFGYKEPWAEYRFNNNIVSGNLAPTSSDVSLTPWTYAGLFSALPVLNSDFKLQSMKNIGGTLVDTTTSTQFLADFYFDITYMSTMPAYSIPGLIDHN